MDEPYKTTVRCPACRRRTFRLIENVETYNFIDVIDGIPHPMQVSEEMPVRVGFKANCMSCDHYWSPRFETAYKIMDVERDNLEHYRETR